jgi:hypothetical protein
VYTSVIVFQKWEEVNYTVPLCHRGSKKEWSKVLIETRQEIDE